MKNLSFCHVPEQYQDKMASFFRATYLGTFRDAKMLLYHDDGTINSDYPILTTEPDKKAFHKHEVSFSEMLEFSLTLGYHVGEELPKQVMKLKDIIGQLPNYD